MVRHQMVEQNVFNNKVRQVKSELFGSCFGSGVLVQVSFQFRFWFKILESNFRSVAVPAKIAVLVDHNLEPSPRTFLCPFH